MASSETDRGHGTTYYGQQQQLQEETAVQDDDDDDDGNHDDNHFLPSDDESKITIDFSEDLQELIGTADLNDDDEEEEESQDVARSSSSSINDRARVGGIKRIRRDDTTAHDVKVPVTLNEVDVICERGAESYYHNGNRYYVKYLQDVCKVYPTLDRKGRYDLTTQVVNRVHSLGGRFVARDKCTDAKDGYSLWYELPYDIARLKASQGLRDAASQALLRVHNRTQKAKKTERRSSTGKAPRGGAPKKRKRKPDEGSRVYVDLTDVDVVCEQGTFANRHPGNLSYLSRVDEVLSECDYANLPKMEKTSLSIFVVEWVHSRNGRFVVRDKNTTDGTFGKWYVTTTETAREKSSQALRSRSKKVQTIQKNLVLDTPPARLVSDETMIDGE